MTTILIDIKHYVDVFGFFIATVDLHAATTTEYSSPKRYFTIKL